MNINLKRYTDDEYLSKKEISIKVGSSELDSVWRNVTDYRERYRTLVNLKKNDSFPFSVCLTPSILSYSTISERKLAKFAMRFNSLSVKQDLSSDKHLDVINQKRLKDDLLEICHYYNIKVDEEDINLSMNSNFDLTSPVSNFYKGLKFLMDGSKNFSLENIFELYKIISGTESANFRNNDSSNGLGSATFRISDYMISLVDFVNSYKEMSAFVLAPIVYGYIRYVLPFEKYNVLIAILLSIKVLKDSGYGDGAFYLNIIKNVILSDKKCEKSIENSGLYGDFTYIIVTYSQIFLTSIDALIDELFAIEIIPNGTTEIKYIEKEVIKEVKVSEVKEELEEEKTIEKPLFKEYSKPVEQPKTFEYVSNDPFALPENDVKKIVIDAKDMSEIALAFLHSDADKLGKALLESNPNMKYHQAYFYAYHHEVGKYYTIAQFKDYALCAYETARTSMEYLTSCKLYRKEQIKNKFVYTPVDLEAK